jgi:hypothetical protein
LKSQLTLNEPGRKRWSIQLDPEDIPGPSEEFLKLIRNGLQGAPYINAWTVDEFIKGIRMSVEEKL